MKPYKTDPERNFVDLYKNTMLDELENATFVDIPLFINGIKVTEKGVGTYLYIYQEIASDVVVIDVHNEDSSLHHTERIFYDKEKSEWVPLPIS